MPEIDTDLFQILALALLFLCLLSLLATLSALSGIKKLLETRSREDSAGVAPVSSAYDYQAPTAATYEPAAAYTPTPAAQTQQQEVNTGFVPMSGGVAAAGQTTSATSLTGGLRGDEPEEQPFERDGKWWFKRGGELLVYDEGTGQWVASPQGAGAAPVAGTQTIAPAVQTDVGEGWKCSSCGAVNGSTATSCRMCFAPR
jgi:hypothetical protein